MIPVNGFSSSLRKARYSLATGRPKGYLNRKIVAREYLAFLQEEVNPLTGIKELLSNEDMIILSLIHRQKKVM